MGARCQKLEQVADFLSSGGTQPAPDGVLLSLWPAPPPAVAGRAPLDLSALSTGALLKNKMFVTL